MRRKTSQCQLYAATRWSGIQVGCRGASLVTPQSPTTAAPRRVEAATRPAVVTWRAPSENSTRQLTPWAELLSRPLTRVALEEVTAACLSQERRSMYAVQKPFGATSASAPGDFTQLIHSLLAAGLVEPQARQVVELFLDLLRKPLHPQHGVLTPWDISDQETLSCEARVTEQLMAALQPREALEWLERQVLGRLPPGAPKTSKTSGFLIYEFMMQNLEPASSARPAIAESGGSSASKAERLVFTPPIVGAVASALFRFSTPRCRQDAMALLERAALSRLTERFHHAVLFDEHVAVQCAEAAAKVGDSETVTRLMFLLYRSKGALGSPSLIEHARTKGVSPAKRASRAASSAEWWRGFWPFRSKADVVDEEALFESAAIRLLKSTIRAALYNNGGTGGTPNGMDVNDHPTIGGLAHLYEAFTLFEALRPGTTWVGAAAMAMELLSFMSARLQESFAAAATCPDANATREIQVCALRVFQCIVRDGSHTAPSSAVRQDVTAHAARLVMQTFTRLISLNGGEPEDGTLTQQHRLAARAPIFVQLGQSSAGCDELAHVVLALFNSVPQTHQETLLPFALSAVTTLAQSSSRTSLTTLPPKLVAALFPSIAGGAALSLFSGLSAYFANVQAPAHLVATTQPRLPFHSVVSGALLLHLSLLTCGRGGDDEGRDDTVMAFASRLCGGGGQGGCDVLNWFTIAAKQQRLALWGLLGFLASARANGGCSPGRGSHPLHGAPGAQGVLLRAAQVVSARPDCDKKELEVLLRVLYANGPPQDADQKAALHDLLTRFMGFTVLAVTPVELARELACKAENTKAAPVQVVVVVTLSAVLSSPPTEKAVDPAEWLASFTEKTIGPLVAIPGSHVSVTFVVTGLALLSLRASAESGGVVASAVLSLLRRSAPPCAATGPTQARQTAGGCPASLHVVVGGPGPVSIARGAGYQQALATLAPRNRDGVDEARELGRAVSSVAPHLLSTAPVAVCKKARAALLLWNEAAVNGGKEEAGTLHSLLSPYGVHLLSVRRARVEQAARQISDIVRGGPSTGNGAASPMRSKLPAGNRLQATGAPKSPQSRALF